MVADPILPLLHNDLWLIGFLELEIAEDKALWRLRPYSESAVAKLYYHRGYDQIVATQLNSVRESLE